MVAPCNYVHAEIGPTNDTVREDCVADKQTQVDYLGNMQIIYYIDEEFFQLQDYENSIERRSRFFMKQVDNMKPTWFDGRYRKNYVEDEISYLQYG